MKYAISGLSLALAGCAAPPATVPPPTAGAVETIRYETSRCYGVCPVYVLTVSSDGRGTFDGRDFTQVKGVQQFTLSREEYAAFARRLAPYRPAGERLITEPNCGGMTATDLSGVDIRWSGKGPESHLVAYYGCDMERNEAMFDALKAAPYALPQVKAMIGRR